MSQMWVGRWAACTVRDQLKGQRLWLSSLDGDHNSQGKGMTAESILHATVGHQ